MQIPETLLIDKRRLIVACFTSAIVACTAVSRVHAGPWLAPGDAGLRHDIQLLADAGLIRSPVTTWPLSWPDIAREVHAADPADGRSDALDAALARVQDAARNAARAGVRARLELAAAHEPVRLRTFSDTPREEGELGVGAGWLGDRAAVQAKITAVADPRDEQNVRLDGSYAAITIANIALAAGWVERWWGPGWEGSLILSTNARPIPGITVERRDAQASRWPLLRWLGPWRAVVAMGQAEGSDVAVPDTRFFAARVNFRPTQWLEIGLARTAQWCGRGRPCDLETFGNLMIGRDNRDESLGIEEEPGNQMAGYDARIRSPWRAVPVALYAQAIGEDEAGGLPGKFLGLFGVEHWGAGRFGSYRMHAEYADTTCNFPRSAPLFDCAYRNALYPQGYSHRGRVIGHALDGDGRMFSVGMILVRSSGTTWSALARRAELDRGGVMPEPAHAASPAANELENAEVQYNRAFARGQLELGAGYDRFSGPARDGSDIRGFLRWRQGF